MPLYDLPFTERVSQSVSRSDGQTKIYIMEDFNLYNKWSMQNRFILGDGPVMVLWLERK